ncbi:MAG: hypothetical protein ACI87E_004631 [Mariniblastus sp.]
MSATLAWPASILFLLFKISNGKMFDVPKSLSNTAT